MTITFKPLERTDFVYIDSWLKEPYVAKAWGNDSWEESYEKYLFRMSSEAIKQFVFQIDQKPAGYIQYYWASKVGDGWWVGFDEKTVGFDLYIGDRTFLGKGLGQLVIRGFIRQLFEISSVDRVIADPSPNNKHIIHILKKVGMRELGEIQTPDGMALLLELTRSMNAWGPNSLANWHCRGR